MARDAGRIQDGRDGGAGEGRGRFRGGEAGPKIFDLALGIAYGWSGRVWARSMAQEGGAAAFGEELRRAREERGVAVEAICAATKVPARHIRALEAGATTGEIEQALMLGITTLGFPTMMASLTWAKQAIANHTK